MSEFMFKQAAQEQNNKMSFMAAPGVRRSLLPLLAGTALLGACRLVDQTTFDPALRARIEAKPQPAPAPASPRLGPPPLLTIRSGADVDYAAALRVAVAEARRRKPDVVFKVVTAEPALAGDEARIAALTRDGGLARRVASDILADGVDPGQVALGAMFEPGLKRPEVRVYVQ